MCIFYSLHLLFNKLNVNENEQGKRNCKLLLLGGLIYLIIFTILKDRRVVTHNVRLDGLISGLLSIFILDISVMAYTYKSYFGRSILNEALDNDDKFNYDENTHRYSRKEENVRIVRQAVEKFNSTLDLYTGKSCCVCLEEYDLDKDSIVSLPCGHILHKECKNKIKDKKCPVCRKTYL
jgi:hypothetical protein